MLFKRPVIGRERGREGGCVDGLNAALRIAYSNLRVCFIFLDGWVDGWMEWSNKPLEGLVTTIKNDKT